MSSLTKTTVIVQIASPQRTSANTQTYPFEFMPYLTNRTLSPASGTTLNSNPWLPLVKKITGLKFDCSDFIPRVTPVNIELDNTPGSYGHDRKFTDELERFTIIDQDIKITIATDDTASYTNASNVSGLYLTGKVTSVRSDTNNQTATITASLYRPNSQPLCAKALPSLPGLKESARSASFPFLFGTNIYTKLIPLNDAAQAAPFGSPLANHAQCYYGFCTTRSITNFSGPSQWYIRDFVDSKYKVFTPFNTAIPIAQLTRSGGSVVNFDLSTDEELADYIKLGSENFTNRVLTQVTITFRGQASYTGTVNGAITIEIYEKGPKAVYSANGSRPNKTAIARAVIEKDTFAAQLIVNADFNVTFVFDKPIYLNGAVGSELWFSISHDDDDDANTLRIPRFSGATATRWRRKSGKNWRKQNSSIRQMFTGWWGLGAGVLPTAPTPDSNGNQARYIMVGAPISFTGQEDFDPSNLDIVVYCDGQKDDVAGTITGTGGLLLQTNLSLLKLLHYSYSPSTATWSSNFNTSHFNGLSPSSSAGLYRKASFAAGNNAMAEQVISEVCRQLLFHIVPVFSNSLNVGYFADGVYKAGFKTITDNEIVNSLYEFKGTDNIVNTVEMNYTPDLLGLDATDLLQRGGQKGFRNFLQRADTSTRSIAIFGIKPLRNVNFPYIDTGTSAEYVRDLILAKYPMPAEYFMVEVPYERHGTEIDFFNQVRVYSSRFPSYFGANASPLLPVYDDGSTAEEGKVLTVDETRGKYIRGAVEAIEFMLDVNKPATVRYTCRKILDGYPYYEA